MEGMSDTEITTSDIDPVEVWVVTIDGYEVRLQPVGPARDGRIAVAGTVEGFVASILDRVELRSADQTRPIKTTWNTRILQRNDELMLEIDAADLLAAIR